MLKSIDAVKHSGRIVSIVSSNINLDAAKNKNVTVNYLFMKRERSKLDALRALIEKGRVKPVIDSVMPLKDVALAQQRLEKGGVRGKIVLKVVED